MRRLLLLCLLALLFLLGERSRNEFAYSSLPAETSSAARLSQTSLPSDVASLHHQSICEGMVAPIPSLHPLGCLYHRLPLEPVFYARLAIQVHQCLPRLAQNYFRNLFLLLRVINAP